MINMETLLAEKYVEHLIREGSKIPLKYEKLIPPSWYDDAKFKRGQQFIRENYFAVSSAMLFQSFVFLIEPKFDELMAKNGKFNMAKSLASHLRAVKSWYNSDIYEKRSVPFKTLYKTGILHERKSPTLVDGQIGITQKDLALGICAFTAIVMSELQHYHTQSAHEFEGYIHFWRVISYHMGQQDEFNLFNGNVYEVGEKCAKIFQIFYEPVLDNPPPTGGIIFTGMVEAASYWFFIVDRDGIVEFVRRKHKLLPRPLKSKKSRIFVSIMIFAHDRMLKTWWITPILRPMLNYLAKISELYVPMMMRLFSQEV